MLSLSALTSLGHEAEIAMHARGALTNGLTPQDIAEVLLHTGVYAGIPAANKAFAVAAGVIAEVEGARASEVSGQARRRSSHARRLLTQPDDVPALQLPAAPCLRRPVDRDGPICQYGLRVGTRVDQPGELEELPEPDAVTVEGYVAHSTMVAPLH